MLPFSVVLVFTLKLSLLCDVQLLKAVGVLTLEYVAVLLASRHVPFVFPRQQIETCSRVCWFIYELIGLLVCECIGNAKEIADQFGPSLQDQWTSNRRQND